MVPARMTWLLVAVMLAGAPAWALEGYVQDHEGQPLEGAKVCYLLPGGTNGMCVSTDGHGYYRLQNTALPRIRVRADGYLLLTVPAVSREEPLRLELAASILVKLHDKSTGQPIGEGRVKMVRPSGARRGPFPANASGVLVETLPPGRIRVSGTAEGYRDSPVRAAELVGGERTEVVLELEPLPPDEPSGA